MKVKLLFKRGEAHLLNYMYKKRDVPALLDTKPVITRGTPVKLHVQKKRCACLT